MTVDYDFVEVYSAVCERCGDTVEAREFSQGEFDEWPVIMDADVASQRRLHSACGGQLILGDVRPAGHVCADGCECQTGGLPDRVPY